ncbi:olfactory receptor 52K2-like [Entelurus aequoreus]|uniref:olfactory receptor 52K2-like n=1 Tax=Entelurus aequoreus TaxID=161455 RepID=UPI002B1CF9DC|nr:olfactory receptor 52K2-like [Entelurus aequoreus]
MMQNSTISHFILGSYLDLGYEKYLFFSMVLLLYMLIVATNSSLVVLICVTRRLRKPMFLFVASLFVNELYGSTGFFPFLMLQILNDVHTISVPACYLQMFPVYTYARVEFCTLAAMSYDRYLAICCPLQYSARVTPHRVLLCICLMWLYSFVRVLTTLCLNLSQLLCGNVINSLYCMNYLVAKLLCGDLQVINIYGLVTTTMSIMLPLLLILYSYLKILHVVFSGTNQARPKALGTCAPHIVSLLNFSFGCIFQVLHTRFGMSAMPDGFRIFLSLYFLIFQPLINPLMYGMQTSQIRETCKHVFSSKTARIGQA